MRSSILLASLAVLTGCAGTDPMAPARAPVNHAASLTAVYDSAMDISLMSGGGQGHAYGISDAGLIVGDNGSLPFSWQQPVGPMRTLTLPSGLQASGGATTTSAGGKYIAGWGSATGFGTMHAVRWDSRRIPIDLGTLGGGSSWANAVDDKGSVVGWSETAKGVMHAFLYTSSGGMVDMGILPGSYRTAQMQAWDINASGIVGCGNAPNGSYVMWSWTAAGGFVTLGPTQGFTCAYAVSTKGAIAGVTDQPIGDNGFTWTAGRGMVLHAAGYSYAHDINADGTAVGEANGFTRAYVADPRGAVVYLPPLVQYPTPSTASAWAINACGDVVGWSNNPYLGETHAIWWPGHRCP